MESITSDKKVFETTTEHAFKALMDVVGVSASASATSINNGTEEGASGVSLLCADEGSDEWGVGEWITTDSISESASSDNSDAVQPMNVVDDAVAHAAGCDFDSASGPACDRKVSILDPQLRELVILVRRLDSALIEKYTKGRLPDYNTDSDNQQPLALAAAAALKPTEDGKSGKKNRKKENKDYAGADVEVSARKTPDNRFDADKQMKGDQRYMSASVRASGVFTPKNDYSNWAAQFDLKAFSVCVPRLSNATIAQYKIRQELFDSDSISYGSSGDEYRSGAKRQKFTEANSDFSRIPKVKIMLLSQDDEASRKDGMRWWLNDDVDTSSKPNLDRANHKKHKEKPVRRYAITVPTICADFLKGPTTVDKEEVHADAERFTDGARLKQKVEKSNPQRCAGKVISTVKETGSQKAMAPSIRLASTSSLTVSTSKRQEPAKKKVIAEPDILNNIIFNMTAPPVKIRKISDSEKPKSKRLSDPLDRLKVERASKACSAIGEYVSPLARIEQNNAPPKRMNFGLPVRPRVQNKFGGEPLNCYSGSIKMKDLITKSSSPPSSANLPGYPEQLTHSSLEAVDDDDSATTSEQEALVDVQQKSSLPQPPPWINKLLRNIKAMRLAKPKGNKTAVGRVEAANSVNKVNGAQGSDKQDRNKDKDRGYRSSRAPSRERDRNHRTSRRRRSSHDHARRQGGANDQLRERSIDFANRDRNRREGEYRQSSRSRDRDVVRQQADQATAGVSKREENSNQRQRRSSDYDTRSSVSSECYGKRLPTTIKTTNSYSKDETSMLESFLTMPAMSSDMDMMQLPSTSSSEFLHNDRGVAAVLPLSKPLNAPSSANLGCGVTELFQELQTDLQSNLNKVIFGVLAGDATRAQGVREYRPSHVKEIISMLLCDPASVLHRDHARRRQAEEMLPILDELGTLTQNSHYHTILQPIVEFATKLLEDSC